MMKELMNWLNANKITYTVIDNEVIEIEDFGKMYLADLTDVKSIFRGTKENVQFNLMENPDILKEEGIFYVAFPFGFNWYYYDLREGFVFNILKYIGKRHPAKMNVPFVNLGIHTPYELLNGSGDLSQWVKKAKLLGQTAIGICDRNTMAATLNLQKECAKAGINHVFGYSFTLLDNDEKVDMKIYCQGQKGLQNLLRIQKEIMVDSADNTISLSNLLKYAKGNVLVPGTLSSYWLHQRFYSLVEHFDKVFYQVDFSEYKAERIDAEYLHAIKYYFDNFQTGQNSFLIEPVLINDCYYLDKDDAKNKITLNKIATGAAHKQSNDQYFKDTDELYEQFKSLFTSGSRDIEALFKRMCQHTVDIADGAKAHFETTKNYMPRYDMTSDEKHKYGNCHKMFLSLLEEGFQRLTPKGKDDLYRKRMEYEIYILESTDNVDYMLVQYDTVKWAREKGILVGCGRGSAGGSLVLYLLGITLIDPIKYDLLFERFILPERAGLYSANVTRIKEQIISSDYIEIGLENNIKYFFDREAQFRILREGLELTAYADELLEGDEILFDNRDLLFHYRAYE